MENNRLATKLDGVLERLHFLQMVIRNLKDRTGTDITDVGDINERLFKEIMSYETSTEELKRDFVMLMIDDAKKLADACCSNIEILANGTEAFDKIEDTLAFIGKSENEDIKKSRELQDFAADAREQLRHIRKNMNLGVSVKREEVKEYEKTQEIHSRIKGGG